MTLLIIPSLLHYSMIAIGVAALGIALLFFWRLFVTPALVAYSDLHSAPPKKGDEFEFVIDSQDRVLNISIGQIDSTIKLRLQGIKEEHLTLRFEKERALEDYAIRITPGGDTFARMPHEKKIERFKSPLIFDSRELIGHTAIFRLAATVRNERALQFVEIELSTRYFINRLGEEKMKFFLKILRIFPGVDQNSRNKRGIYGFSRSSSDDNEQDDEGVE